MQEDKYVSEKSRFQRKKQWADRAFALLFLAAVCFSCGMTVYTSRSFLQGDVSSTLVYAHHLFERGVLLSTDWIGSTDLHILQTHLIFGPLFAVLKDWRMVRLVGTLIIHVLLVASYGYLVHETRLGKRVFYIGSTILLLPVSFAYGVSVLYGVFYPTFLMVGFVLAGMLIAILRSRQEKHRRVRQTVRIIVMLALSLLSGMGGPRQPMHTQIPIMLALMMIALQTDRLADDARRTLFCREGLWKGMVLAAASCVMAVAGYLINYKVLGSIYSFAVYDGIKLAFDPAGRINDILFGILNTFGFRTGTPVLSRPGIASLGGLLAGGYYLYCMPRMTLRYDEEDTFASQFVEKLCSATLIVMLCINLFTDDNHLNENYYLPVVVWFVPVLAQKVDRACNELLSGAVLKARHLLIAAVCLTLGINSLYNVASFVNPETYPQYCGMSFRHVSLSEEIDGAARFLDENDYELGYASLWYANVITEKTDGDVKMINVKHIGRNQNYHMVYHNWLTQISYRDMDVERPFILMAEAEAEDFQTSPAAEKAELVYSDAYFWIYAFDNPSDLEQLIHQ